MIQPEGSQAWWFKPVIPVLKVTGQEFKSSLGNTADPHRK